MKSAHGFASILIIGLILALGSFGFVFYKVYINPPKQQFRDEAVLPTPASKTNISTESSKLVPSPPLDQTASWKTYTSPDKSFTFKYPHDWTINTQSDNKVEFNSSYSNFMLYIYKGSNIKTYEAYPKCNAVPKDIPSVCVSENPTNTTLGQKPAIRFIIGSNRTDYYRDSVQIVNDPKIELNMNEAGGGLSRTFDQILSTFKFTQ